ncbi:MAG: hypothetical protein FXF47_08760 [Candidatus Mcinerneyibacterium aminivorans]|uniref:Glycogen debranching protein n=1 Tax=Candidatus Mcinerneyibacterium aminivorans TaxID=2703815 RepID=A0A5D0M9S0_9BACT|nr:MAG: hypothetical protein FXF47_08760 [Candidatus Mcinerneyibacterium aminivorans]
MSYDNYKKEVFHHEWILTNNFGGYSLGFGNLINERKYNGLLIAADKTVRNHIVFNQEEKVECGIGNFYLDSNSYLDCIYPNGYKHIVKSWLRPYPSVLFSSLPFNEKILILKEIKMHKEKNITLVKYTNLSSQTLYFTVRPKYTLRNHHHINKPGYWQENNNEVNLHKNGGFVKNLSNNISGYTYFDKGMISVDEMVFEKNYYTIEASRGYDAVEDLLSPFKITFTLDSRTSNYILFSDNKIEDLKGEINKIEKRYPVYLLPKDHPVKRKRKSFEKNNLILADKEIFTFKQYKNILKLAMKDFYIKDDIVAGYPWFYCWGRDTFISLKAFADIKGFDNKMYKIFTNYGNKIKQGIIPNMIIGSRDENNYDTVDASLWFIVRAFELMDKLKTKSKKKKIFNYIKKILLSYLFNDNHLFRLDEDKLIDIVSKTVGITWMDARVYNKAVTPRMGKCIEINCLWYNALRLFVKFASRMDINENTEIVIDEYGTSINYIEKVANLVKESMQKFVKNDRLVDRIYNDNKIDDIRPNAVIGLSLPFKPFNRRIIENTFIYTKKELLTPFGLRSLSPDDSKFKRKYMGDQVMRDMAYHQGTVWAWILLPYVNVYYWLYKNKYDKQELKKEIEGTIINFRQMFLKGYIGTVAEVWDGIDPDVPKGCPAQAWSTAALFEIEKIIERM